ncbi:hypothetical protein L6164_016113 [Bauhinia variegata]|uniref:Uncharacterized protein n=1 Tax=Bauhinia variegata TaxID=167791 RepID=A0ACB9NMN5_BAUVA|nr:hypothetical protein L6164_016113 [Bauhinia variegata]
MAFRFLLCLLLVNVLVDRAIALKFSLKLIHRYSDEAMVLWVSRNKNVSVESWPNKNSSDYFKLLLSSDLTRQKMKLASQYNFLYPSQGSQTLFFGNAFDWLHYAWIDLGTPNVSFLVALDTGSDQLWVPCDCIECAPLSAGYYNVLDRDLSEYSPSLSSTSRHLPCSHQLCDQGPNCKSPKEPCPYIVQYSSENTSSSGFLIEDKLHLASDGRYSTESSVQASIILGCGRKQSGGYLEGAAPDGVMGLGPGGISVPSFLAKAGLIRNSFSICFNNNSGRILFGDQGHAPQQSTPFLLVDGDFIAYIVGVKSFCVGSSCLKQTGFQALIDSGTSFTYLPSEVYKRVVLEYDKQFNARRIISQQYPWEYCYNVSSRELTHIPTVKLSFAKNQTFLIHNPMFSHTANQEYTLVCLTVMPTDDDYGTIGQNFMMGYNMVFDRENLRFGWSNSNCEDNTGDRANFTSSSNEGSSNLLPANQQQSIPNTTAVSPTVAGKASPKPSIATLRPVPSWYSLSSLSLMYILFFCLSHRLF